MEGVDNIIGIIKTKTAEKTEKIIADAEAFKNERIKRAQERAKSIVEKASGKADQEENAEISKYRASAILKQKYKALNTKESIMKEVLDSAWETTAKRAGKADYKAILMRLAVDGGVALDVDEIEILLPQDIKSTIDTEEVAKAIGQQTGKKPKVKLSDEKVRASGGLIVRAIDGSKWVDNTFEARRSRLENQIRDTVSSVLFVEEKES